MYSIDPSRNGKPQVPPQPGDIIRHHGQKLLVRAVEPGSILHCWSEDDRETHRIPMYPKAPLVIRRRDSDEIWREPLLADPYEENLFLALYRAKGPGSGWIKFPKCFNPIMTPEQQFLLNFLVDWMQGLGRGIFMRNGCRFYCPNKAILERVKWKKNAVDRVFRELKKLGFIRTEVEHLRLKTKRSNRNPKGFVNRRWISIDFAAVWEAVSEARKANQQEEAEEDDWDDYFGEV